MTTISGGASLWLASAWSALQSTSRGPSIQDFIDSGTSLADSLATISQNQTTGRATLATQAAQKRIQSQIAALKKQLNILA